jgi:outer membrane lipoprotein-sorting protein
MTLDEELDQSLSKLRDAITPRRSIVADVMARTDSRSLAGARAGLLARTWMPLRRPRFAVAAVAAMIVLSVAGFLLIDRQSSSVFANQALAALQQAKADGVTVKERTIFVMRDGSRHISSTSDTFFVGRDSYRRDIYDNDKLRESQWYTRKGDGMRQTSVRFDTKTYTVLAHTGSYGNTDPVERMSLLTKFVGDADRRLEPVVINGVKCPGFEIRASKYGTNPNDWFDRIWFDPAAKLPVRIEQERPRSEKDLKAFITVQEQFDWHPDLSADTFTPKIPDGFTLQK